MHPTPTLRRCLTATAHLFMVTAIVVFALPRSAVARGHAVCAGARTRVADATSVQIRRAVLCLINRQRTARGLPALRDSWRLDRSAQGWTDVMVRRNQFSHGANFSIRITRTGFRWSAAGENIAAGFRTPASVVRGWMGSPGHCRNILAPDYADVGTGVVNRGIRGCGPATWTNDFAQPRGAPVRSHNYGPADGCPY